LPAAGQSHATRYGARWPASPCPQPAKPDAATLHAVLYSDRKRLAALAEAEARGESFWTDQLDDPAVRGKLLDAWFKTVRGAPGGGGPRDMIDSQIRQQATWDTGNLEPPSVVEALGSGSVDETLSYIEAIYNKTVAAREQFAAEYYHPEFWAERINEIFNSHRIAFRLVDGEIVPLSSDELHVEVVVPTLRLLHGRKDFENAHTAYLKALKEISNNDAADAITDAGTALQETLLALGCEGNALGPLLKSACGVPEVGARLWPAPMGGL
jgi:hypothetical protein